MTDRPAFDAWKAHLDRCPYHGNIRRCQACFDLDREANAESWRRSMQRAGRLAAAR